MPIIQEQPISPQVSICIWKIDETEEALLAFLELNETEFADFDRVKVASKRLEWLAARNALKQLLNPFGQFWLEKDQFGKPHLTDPSIGVSMSHANGFGAAAINHQGPIGIDIEIERPQIQRISRKFLNENETWAGTDTTKLTQVWGGKEALYKLHGRTQLIFADQLVIEEPSLKHITSGQIIEQNKAETFSLYFDYQSPLHICCAF
ncbi:4'-phosphopantetheinyl transferase family protein [Roseivirga pacifica]|jgi:4'-phosphopantetheinyl transferase|uniref:4'-phosphopantetheinyl transferase family protein n=1 Tax=Roseivirga pacifica TaxID=1267423 RepID=UPI003BA8F904